MGPNVGVCLGATYGFLGDKVSEHPRPPQLQSTDESGSGDDRAPVRNGRDAAQRALDEAHAREEYRQLRMPKEINGRDGPEPTRFGDWEVKGLATDF